MIGRGGGLTRCGFAAALLVGVAMAAPQELSAQDAQPPLSIQGLEATPVGALPPLALPMPASRNHNYWAFRFQAGHRRGREGPDLLAVAGGVDLQWRGGSMFGVTGGYQQRRDCAEGVACDGHAMFGARARFNVVTGGPTIASVFGDYSATSTLGAEVGFGYAPEVDPGRGVCTFDLGVPVSVAMLQHVRLVSYVMPALAWDVDCGSGSEENNDLLLNAGVGVQQLILDGLDIYLGFQKSFSGGTGYQFGLSVMYVHLP